MRTFYGDCVVCKQPIRPPFLTFEVSLVEQEPNKDPTTTGWSDVDICNECAKTTTVAEFFNVGCDKSGPDDDPDA